MYNTDELKFQIRYLFIIGTLKTVKYRKFFFKRDNKGHDYSG